MRVSVFLLCWLTPWLAVFPQVPSFVVVRSGADPSKAIPVAQRYRYADFLSGSITYNNDQVATAKLNYQYLLGEVQFLNPRGDTLSLADELAIKQIAIGDTLFYYAPAIGYLEVIADYGAVKLAMKQKLSQTARKKLSAYDQTSGSSAITNYRQYRDQNGALQQLPSKADVVFSGEVSYFLMDANRRFHRVNKSNTLKIFAKHKKTIEQYWKEHPVDFHQRADLERLVEFCSQLT